VLDQGVFARVKKMAVFEVSAADKPAVSSNVGVVVLGVVGQSLAPVRRPVGVEEAFLSIDVLDGD